MPTDRLTPERLAEIERSWVSAPGTAVRYREVIRELVDEVRALWAERDELRAALQGLLAPAKHLDGCLFKADSRMPCQCGLNDRVTAAMTAAQHAIAQMAAKREEPTNG